MEEVCTLKNEDVIIKLIKEILFDINTKCDSTDSNNLMILLEQIMVENDVVQTIENLLDFPRFGRRFKLTEKEFIEKQNNFSII